nr:TIGR04149 family rSAM-modified RiPP [uncultured Bacteroides sp.]
MNLKKLKLNEIEKVELNEREMCRVLGGGTSGCCQCGCMYADSNGSSSSDNSSANNKFGYTSDPSIHPCCDAETIQSIICNYEYFGGGPQDALCPQVQGFSCGR